ncbi:MAG: hypothetical protein HJJLKODD_00119 [Phycisphaerae bacterium]|nr:hypothetical protein [Phycisphaerae bacterium]
MNHTLIQSLTSPTRLAAIALLFTGVWGVAFVAKHALAPDVVNQSGEALGRDFLAFYVAGRIVQQGDGAQIYDPVLQTRITKEITPGIRGYQYFINPASVAAVYTLVAALPYMPAFYLHVVIMATCYLLGMWLLRKELTGLKIRSAELARHTGMGLDTMTGLSGFWIAALLGISWMPMMHTITGGQNAGLVFLLLCWAYVATRRNQPIRAGLALGLLLFKPQYALPFIGLLLLKRRWRTVGLALLLGVGHYALGAAVCGTDWPVKMQQALNGYYRAEERKVSGHSHIAITEAIDYSIIQPLERRGVSEQTIRQVRWSGYALVGLVIAALIWWWRDADPSRPDFGLYWGTVTALLPSISLHAQYYDGALLVLPLVLTVDGLLMRQIPIRPALRWALVLLYFLYPLIFLLQFSKIIGFQLLSLVPPAVALWCGRWTLHAGSKRLADEQ